MNTPTFLLRACTAAAISLAAVLVPDLARQGAWAQGAAPPNLQLCTAGRGGIYHFAGRQIAAASDRARVSITVLESDGSLANTRGLANGTCDAAILQADAILAYDLENPDNRLDLAPLDYLHREYVHLVCRRDAQITEVADLVDGAETTRILMGAVGSGSHVTWRSFTRLDPDYAPVLSVAIDDREAMASALIQGRAECLLFVTGLNSAYMAALEERGDAFRLVPVDDGDFDDFEMLGNKLYKFARIPAETYPRLQVDTGAVETISIRALFAVRAAWAAIHMDAHDAVRSAVAQANDAILRRAGERPAR